MSSQTHNGNILTTSIHSTASVTISSAVANQDESSLNFSSAGSDQSYLSVVSNTFEEDVAHLISSKNKYTTNDLVNIDQDLIMALTFESNLLYNFRPADLKNLQDVKLHKVMKEMLSHAPGGELGNPRRYVASSICACHGEVKTELQSRTVGPSSPQFDEKT